MLTYTTDLRLLGSSIAINFGNEFSAKKDRKINTQAS